MSTHTEGPWHVDLNVLDRSDRVSVSHGIETLCTVYGLGKKTGNANARLIATAPELLAVTKASWHAIQSLLAVREGITDEALHDLAKILDFTIRRAEGKSS